MRHRTHSKRPHADSSNSDISTAKISSSSDDTSTSTTSSFGSRRRSTTSLAMLSILAVASAPLTLVHSLVNPQTPPQRLTLPTNVPGRPNPFASAVAYRHRRSPTALGYENDKNIPEETSLPFNNGGNNATDTSRPQASSTRQTSREETQSSSSVSATKTPPLAKNIRYRGTWYDVTKWRRAHSAGAHWLDWFDQRDATEIIDGLHSTHSRQMATRLPKAAPELAAELEANAEPDSKVQIAFRALFDKLLAEGWWERDWKFEAGQLSIWASLFVGALATAHSVPTVSFVLLALSFVGGGWLGHDYLHGLDKFSKSLRLFLPITTGLSGRWWSDKHNKHHALSK